ncbi:UbiD family decarboxylase [Clostridium sp.]|uniref:UbiD family decarboxylase n=1 Tax=Clostridium sp. TaxID=1506 RepID=UPI00284FE999|nr:UbiD family decarboxylase [Clostridium sp.]MDR3594212.1 UbiD family decarboxylase [Clostridium sp.]
MNRIKSFREYIERLKDIGEVKEIEEEVDWNLEMGAIIRWCNENGAPVPLFKNIKGIEKGFRALGAPAGVSRQKDLYLSRYALSIGMSPKATGKEIIEALIEGYSRKPVDSIIVSSASCKENILIGEEVDLYKLPVPYAHYGDGGRYINTWGTIIVQSPDKKWTNWSIARIMIYDKKTMVGMVAGGQHIGKIRKMWGDLGKEVPFAIAFGTEPMIPLVAGSTLVAEGMNEADYISGYYGEPIELVKAETNDILVPANSEIILEGTLSTTETAMEGPMGEYSGYLIKQSKSEKPIYHVTAMTYRNNPIYPIVVAGAPIDDDHPVMGIGACAEILNSLRKHEIPATMAWMPFEAACTWLVITMPKNWKDIMNCSMKELIKKIGDAVYACKGSFLSPKIIVVNDDIDPTDTNQVAWAFGTRNHQFKEVYYRPESRVIGLIPYLDSEEKKVFKTTACIYNCLWPEELEYEDYHVTSSFKGAFPKQVQESAMDKLVKAGFLK